MLLVLQMRQTYCDFDHRHLPELLWIHFGCNLQLRLHWHWTGNHWHNLQRTLPVFQLEGSETAILEHLVLADSRNRQRRLAKISHRSRHHAGVASGRGAEEKHALESRLMDCLHLLHCSHRYNEFRATCLTFKENQMEKWPWRPVPHWLWQLGQREGMHKSHSGSIRMRWRKKHKNI